MPGISTSKCAILLPFLQVSGLKINRGSRMATNPWFGQSQGVRLLSQLQTGQCRECFCCEEPWMSALLEPKRSAKLFKLLLWFPLWPLLLCNAISAKKSRVNTKGFLFRLTLLSFFWAGLPRDGSSALLTKEKPGQIWLSFCFYADVRWWNSCYTDLKVFNIRNGVKYNLNIIVSLF